MNRVYLRWSAALQAFGGVGTASVTLAQQAALWVPESRLQVGTYGLLTAPAGGGGGAGRARPPSPAALQAQAAAPPPPRHPPRNAAQAELLRWCAVWQFSLHHLVPRAKALDPKVACLLSNGELAAYHAAPKPRQLVVQQLRQLATRARLDTGQVRAPWGGGSGGMGHAPPSDCMAPACLGARCAGLWTPARLFRCTVAAAIAEGGHSLCPPSLSPPHTPATYQFLAMNDALAKGNSDMGTCGRVFFYAMPYSLSLVCTGFLEIWLLLLPIATTVDKVAAGEAPHVPAAPPPAAGAIALSVAWDLAMHALACILTLGVDEVTNQLEQPFAYIPTLDMSDATLRAVQR